MLPDCPEEFDQIISQLLEKDPENRPFNARTVQGVMMEIARELERRCISLFECDANDARPAHGEESHYADDPAWNELILFYEYFNADTGEGLGASHQTGWTALVASMIRSQAELPKHPPVSAAVS